MRFMVIIKADQASEAGAMPSEQMLADMTRFNEELVNAGVMLAGDGLHPSAKGARVRFEGQQRTVIDGPFAETRELIAGFWIWQVPSKAAAIEWLKRCPNPSLGDCEVELRQVFEAEDFGDAMTPELVEKEARLKAQLEAQVAGGASASAASPGQVAAVPPARGATPYLVIKDAHRAIDFYQQVFGAEVLMRLDAPDGLLMHAELKVGPASFMMTEERPQYGSLSPLTVGGASTSVTVYVPDADAVIAKAEKAGAKLTMPVQNQFWGDRCGNIADPFGHLWMIATHVEDPTPEEIERRLQALFKSQQGPC